jgi:hypothetical protein
MIAFWAHALPQYRAAVPHLKRSTTQRKSHLAWASEAESAPRRPPPPPCHFRASARRRAPPSRDSRRSLICDASRAQRLTTSFTLPSCQLFWSTQTRDRPRRATPRRRLPVLASAPSLRRRTARPCHPSRPGPPSPSSRPSSAQKPSPALLPRRPPSLDRSRPRSPFLRATTPMSSPCAPPSRCCSCSARRASATSRP